MKKTKNNKIFYTKGFTLVELIIVITLLIILAVIAFISYQSFSKDARDTNRMSTMKNLQNGLEIFSAKSGFYPDPEGTILTGSIGGFVYSNKGTIGENISKIIQFSKIPKDPLSNENYVYAIDSTKKQYQIATTLEKSMASNLFLQTYAGNDGIYRAYVLGNYKGYIKYLSGTTNYLANIPSLIWNNTGSVDLLSNNTYFVVDKTPNLPYKPNNDTNINVLNGNEMIKQITQNNSGTLTGVDISPVLSGISVNDWLNSLSNSGVILASFFQSTDLTTGLNQLNIAIKGASTPAQVEKIVFKTPKQISCESAGWAWVNSENDMYIGINKGNGFCISPTINFANQDPSNGGVSWNGWGATYYNGWSFTQADNDVSDAGNGGQTRNITTVVDNSTQYTCQSIGSATVGFRNSSNQDNQAGQDTLENRMRYLSYYKNNYSNISNISWISSNAKPSGHLIFPALILADCVDGVKDLGNNIDYTNINGVQNTITYSQYNTQESSTALNLSNTTYQNRQKYLLGWSQKTGSHLPSGYSYFTDGTTGGCDSGTCTAYPAGNGKGEYQSACEMYSGNIAGTNDTSSALWIWLSAVGDVDGSKWGHYSRIVGGTDCGTQAATISGYRGFNTGVRIVVR